MRMMTPTDLLVWIDLEMTGLNHLHDVIVEIATIITDSQLSLVAEGPRLVINHSQDILNRMNDWVRTCHESSGLLAEIATATCTTAQAEEQTLAFIKQYCEEKKAILAGNSVWNDKFFLQIHMPQITNYLNYRIVDVTSIKELVTRWYGTDPNARFIKKETHRALDDIKESIEELRHYKQYFFK